MEYAKILSAELNVPEQYAAAAIALIDEGNTIPFIARYRKEATNAMDDQVLRTLAERLDYLRGLEKRKGEVAAVITEQGAMTEPVACCLHGIDMCNIKPGSTVVVIGGGMIGLLMMQLAKNAGATKVVLLEPVEGKREVALKLGADLAIDSIHEDVPARLKQEGVGNVDVVIECVGKPVTIEQAIQIAGHKATVMMFGLTKPDETITVKPFEVFQKELVLTSSYINPYTQRRALELIDSGRLDVSSMVAKVASLDELGAILSDPALRAMGKYIIDPSK